MKKFIQKISILTIVLVMSFSASAASITSDLTITGALNFDSNMLNGSVPAQGNATQTATMESILGGTLSTSTVNNVTVAGNFSFLTSHPIHFLATKKMDLRNSMSHYFMILAGVSVNKEIKLVFGIKKQLKAICQGQCNNLVSVFNKALGLNKTAINRSYGIKKPISKEFTVRIVTLACYC